MNPAMRIGLISEILLVAGILFVASGVYIAVNNRIFSACAIQTIGDCSYSNLFETPIFCIGLALLTFAAVGFLFTLNASRSHLHAKQGENP